MIYIQLKYDLFYKAGVKFCIKLIVLEYIIKSYMSNTRNLWPACGEEVEAAGLDFFMCICISY